MLVSNIVIRISATLIFNADTSLNPNSKVIDANREIIQIFSGDDTPNKVAQRLSYRGYPDQELQFALIRADKLSHQNEGANIVKAAADDNTDAPSLAEIIARQRSEKQRSKSVISPIEIEQYDSKTTSVSQTPQVASPAVSSSTHSQLTPQQTDETPVQTARSLDDHDSAEQDVTPSKRSSSSKSEQVEELADEQTTRGLGLRDSDSMENYQIGDFAHSPNTTAANSVTDRSSQASSVMTSSTNDRVTSGEGFDDIIERLWQRETKDENNNAVQDGAKGPHKDLMRSQSSFSLQTAHTDLSSSSMSTITGQEFADARSTPLSRRSRSNSSGSEDDEKAIREIQSAPVNFEGEGGDEKRQSVESRSSRGTDAESVKSFDDSTKESTQEAVPQLQTHRQSASTVSSVSESGRRSNTPSTTATTNPTPPSVLFHAQNPITNGTASTDESHENTYENMRTADDVDSSASSRSSISTPNHATPPVNSTTSNDRKTKIGHAMQNLNIGHFLTLSQHARRQEPSTPSKDSRERDYIDETWFARSNHDSVYESVRSDLDGIEGVGLVSLLTLLT